MQISPDKWLCEESLSFTTECQEMHLLLGSRDGAVVRALASHQCGPGSIPGLGVICGLDWIPLKFLFIYLLIHQCSFHLSTQTILYSLTSTSLLIVLGVEVGHFQVALSLIMKLRLSAKLLCEN